MDLHEEAAERRYKDEMKAINRVENKVELGRLENQAGFKKVREKLDDARGEILKELESMSQNAPKYMLVVPDAFDIYDKLKLKSLLNQQIKVVFLCPVSLIVPRDANGVIKGYTFNFSNDWYTKWGPVIEVGSYYLSFALTIASPVLLGAGSGVANVTNAVQATTAYQKWLKDNVGLGAEVLENPTDQVVDQLATYAEVKKLLKKKMITSIFQVLV